MSDTAFCCPFPLMQSLETLHRRPEERIRQTNSLKFELTRSCFVRFADSANASPIPLGGNWKNTVRNATITWKGTERIDALTSITCQLQVNSIASKPIVNAQIPPEAFASGGIYWYSINCCGIALKCSARCTSNQSMGFIVGKRFLTWNSCAAALSILCFAYRSHFPVCDNSVHFPAESIHHSGAPSGVCGATPTFRISERL